MSPFLDAIRSFAAGHVPGVIRLSQAWRDQGIETAEMVPACRCQNVYSVAKTFTMTAIGLLFDRGLVRLDDRVLDILADDVPASGVDPRWEGVTVEMALTHKLGLPEGFLDIDVNPISRFGDDFLGYMLTYPLIDDPGKTPRYTDGAFYLLARVAEKKAGMPLEDLVWRELFWPMGFQEVAWSHCPRGHAMGATGLYVHSADVARLALLYRDGGAFEGRRLLSARWTDLAVSRGFALDMDPSRCMYAKGGMYGQLLSVFPQNHRVLAVQGFHDDCMALARFAMDYGDNP